MVDIRLMVCGLPLGGRARGSRRLLCALLLFACSGLEPSGSGARQPGVPSPPEAQVPAQGRGQAASWQSAAARSDWEEVARRIDALPAVRRDEPATAFVRAVAAVQLGDCDDALQWLAAVAGRLPLLQEELARMTAECQLEVGPYEPAAEYHARLGTTAGQLKAARAWLRAGRPARAQRLLDEVVKKTRRAGAASSSYIAARSLGARAAERLGQLERARRDYLWLATEGAVPEAAAQYERLSGTELTKAQRLKRAQAFAKRGRVKAVEGELERLRRAPGEPPRLSERLRALARAHYSSRANDLRAAELYEHVANMTRNAQPDDLFMAAAARARAGQDGPAAALYDRIIALYPNTKAEERARYRRARLRYERGKWADAERAYTEYLARYSARRRGRFRAASLYERAIAQLAQGRSENALQSLKRLGSSGREPHAMLQHLEGVALAASGSAELEERAARQFEAIVRRYPLSFAALASGARLEQLGRRAPSLPAPPRVEPTWSPLELPPKVRLLAGLGLYSAAESALRADEATLRERYNPRGGQRLCELYAALDRGGRGYTLALSMLKRGTLLAAPTASTLWAWQCMYPRPYAAAVTELEARYALPSELVYAVMRQESAFRPDARSPVGALGLMQLMPSTAARAASELSKELEAARLTSTRYNLELGAFYLSRLLDEFEGRAVLALAAYNAGPHAVSGWLEGSRPLPLDLWVARIPFRETRKYVQRVTSSWARYRYLAGGPDRVPRLALNLPDEVRLSADIY